MTTDTKRCTRFLRFLASVVAALAWLGLPADATPTDPDLVLSLVEVVTGSSGSLVHVEGIFPSEDLMQIPYPLQVLVRETQGALRYVRFDLSGVASSGTLGAPGPLTEQQALGLLAGGTPTPAADVTFLGRQVIEVQLPHGALSGATEVQLFVLDEGEVIFSNPISISVEVAP